MFVKLGGALIAASIAAASAQADTKRGVEIRQIDYRGKRIARISFAAFEEEGDIRYPLTTLDRETVRIEVLGAPDGAAIRSLVTAASGTSDAKRAMVVAFNGGSPQLENSGQELRSSIADFLNKLPSRYLAVAMSEDDKELPLSLLGESSPENAENLVLFQRSILEAEAGVGGFARMDGLCFAAQRFADWPLEDFEARDQKIAVIIGADRLTSAASDPACAKELNEMGVRVYEVSWAAAIKSSKFRGGFAHRVKGPVDVATALSNVAANLNGEYTVDAELPMVPKAAQPLEITLVASYAGQDLRSVSQTLPDSIPELNEPEVESATPALGKPPEPRHKWPFIAAGIACLVLAAAAFFLQKKRQNPECNACGRAVDKTHRRCPFRDTHVVARLIVLDGPLAGRTLPLRRGDSAIGRSPTSTVRIGGRGVSWHRHGVLSIEGNKILYNPRGAPGKDRVNGWPVSEPRLLGAGYVLQVGERQLRLEVKIDAPWGRG